MRNQTFYWLNILFVMFLIVSGCRSEKPNDNSESLNKRNYLLFMIKSGCVGNNEIITSNVDLQNLFERVSSLNLPPEDLGVSTMSVGENENHLYVKVYNIRSGQCYALLKMEVLGSAQKGFKIKTLETLNC